MFKIIKIIGIVVVVLIAAVLGFAMTKPDSFSVQHTANIKAPPEKIFPLIIDLHNWGSWSPWEKLDPTMKRTYSDAEPRAPCMSGKGTQKATTSLSSRWNLRATLQTSLGSCAAQLPSFQKSFKYSSAWTAWSARTSTPAWLI